MAQGIRMLALTCMCCCLSTSRALKDPTDGELRGWYTQKHFTGWPTGNDALNTTKEMECTVRQLAYEYALELQPERAPLMSVFDALQLENKCDVPRPQFKHAHKQQSKETEREKQQRQNQQYESFPPHPSTVSDYQEIQPGAFTIHVYPHNDKNVKYDTARKCGRVVVDTANQEREEGPCVLKSLQEALELTRVYGVEKQRAIVLREGIHFLQQALVITPNDSNLLITNFPGEEAWISGGVLLNSQWQFVEEKQQQYGEEEEDEDEEEEGGGGGGVWVTHTDLENVEGLNTMDARLTRARYPNANPEDRFTVKSLNGPDNILRWHPPPVLPRAKQELLNLTALINKTSSTQPEYNFYVNGKCDYAGDTNCPCGAWIDTTYGKHPVSESYWCSNMCAGGWAFIDQGNHFYNGPIIPEGLSYNTTGEFGRRAAKWKNATGAIVVAWRQQGWFVNMFAVKKHDRKTGQLTWDRWSGGWQGGRGWQLDGKTGEISPNPGFFVENVFEELDTAGEWYFDKATRKLFYFHDVGDKKGQNPVQTPNDATFIVPVLSELIGIRGDPSSTGIVRNVTIQGVGLRDAQATFMRRWGVPSGGDWSLYRGGTVFIEGSEDVHVKHCLFKRVDGNGLILSGYNRGAWIHANEFVWIGDTAMAAWGYTEGYDGSSGHQPQGTRITHNIAHELGVFQLQSAMWFQAKTSGTVLHHNIFFNGPRSGINFNDGFGGGNVVFNNLLFNLCRHSGDHGPINSWDRTNYLAIPPPIPTTALLLEPDTQTENSNNDSNNLDNKINNSNNINSGKKVASWEPVYTVISSNFIIANYGGSQGVDNDDGSRNYNIHHNFFYGEGLKMDYGGYGSLFKYNFILVHKYDGQNCLNTGNFAHGLGHVFANNTCAVLYTEKLGTIFGCDPNNPSGTLEMVLANNTYMTPQGQGVYFIGGNKVNWTISELNQKSGKRRAEQGSISTILPDPGDVANRVRGLLWENHQQKLDVLVGSKNEQGVIYVEE